MADTAEDLDHRTAIRDWLRGSLDVAGLSINELARRSGVDRSTIWRALSAEYEFTPSTTTLAKLRQALAPGLQSQADATADLLDNRPLPKHSDTPEVRLQALSRADGASPEEVVRCAEAYLAFLIGAPPPTA